MSQIDLDAIQRELDTVQGTYQMRFAGQPRITRSIGVMEDLITRVRGLKDQLASAPTARDGAETVFPGVLDALEQ